MLELYVKVTGVQSEFPGLSEDVTEVDYAIVVGTAAAFYTIVYQIHRLLIEVIETKRIKSNVLDD